MLFCISLLFTAMACVIDLSLHSQRLPKQKSHIESAQWILVEGIFFCLIFTSCPLQFCFSFFLNPCLLFIYFSLSMSLPLTFSFSFCLPPSILLIPFLTSSLHHLLNCFCHFFFLLLTLLTISRCWYLIIFPAPPNRALKSTKRRQQNV